MSDVWTCGKCTRENHGGALCQFCFSLRQKQSQQTTSRATSPPLKAEASIKARYPFNSEGDSTSEELDADQTCLICLSRLIDTLLVPCRHQVSCYECAMRLAEKHK